jgi:UPF0755 protein
MKSLLRFIGLVVVLAVVAGAYMTFQVNRAYKGFDQPVFVDFKRGTSTSAMADELARQGVIESPWMFKAARAIRRNARLQAGEYRFATAASPLEVFTRIQKGDIYYTELLVPEGTNIFDMATLVATQSQITAAAFLAAAKNPAIIRNLDPAATSLEGYLFPSKYRIYRHTTAAQLCAQMTAEFRKQWARVGSGDVHSTVTLASLVEREAHLHEEQPQVASVFKNRLRLGMKLDCDPTTVYAALLEKRYKGVIHQSDLASDNPYNTYRHAGLPPGPIANPGLGALKAAASPAETPFLFFVAKADGSGGHYFNQTLREHLAAVNQYHRAGGK